MFWCIPAALQLHYATLQSLALDQTEEPPPVEDKTMPRNKQIKDVSGIADVNFFSKINTATTAPRPYYTSSKGDFTITRGRSGDTVRI